MSKDSGTHLPFIYARGLCAIGTCNVVFDKEWPDVFFEAVTQEEMSKVIDMGHFYCVKADNRDLNYEKYYSLGSKSADDSSSYNSHNVRQLSI